MGAQGTTTLDFGAFPGKAQTTRTITGQAGINASSLIEAWVGYGTTADHSEDEHAIEDFFVSIESVVIGAGFDIWLWPKVGRCYGLYNISWAWN